jgi:hypothetical protein
MWFGALIIFALAVLSAPARAGYGYCTTSVQNNGQTSYTTCTYYGPDGYPYYTTTVCYAGVGCIIH